MAYADRKAVFAYNNDYQKRKYDRITILRPTGDKKKLEELVKIKGYASMNAFVNSCIDEKLKRMKIEL